MVLTKLKLKDDNDLFINDKRHVFLPKTASYPLNLSDYNRYSCNNENIRDISSEDILNTIQRYSSSLADCEYDFDNENENETNELNKSKCDKCLDLLDEIENLNRKLEELSKKVEKNAKVSQQENVKFDQPAPIYSKIPVKSRRSAKDSSKAKSVLQFIKKLNPFK